MEVLNFLSLFTRINAWKFLMQVRERKKTQEREKEKERERANKFRRHLQMLHPSQQKGGTPQCVGLSLPPGTPTHFCSLRRIVNMLRLLRLLRLSLRPVSIVFNEQFLPLDHVARLEKEGKVIPTDFVNSRMVSFSKIIVSLCGNVVLLMFK